MKPYYETKLGKLYHGDCLEIMPQLEPVDLVVTDPPYFIPAFHCIGVRGEKLVKRTLADTSILRGYFKQFFEIVSAMVPQDGTIYVFCDGQSYSIFYETLFPHCKYVRPLIWDKMISYNGYTWRHQHELIVWGERENSIRVPTGDGDIIKCRGVLQKNKKHRAEKPVGIISPLIQKHENALVCDPFLGSGTTAVACEQLNREWIGIEISEEYCEIAAKRLEQETSQLKLFTG